MTVKLVSLYRHKIQVINKRRPNLTATDPGIGIVRGSEPGEVNGERVIRESEGYVVQGGRTENNL